MLFSIPLWLSVGLLIYASVSDLRTREVPDWVSVALVVLAIGAKLLGWHPVSWLNILLGAGIPFAIFAALLWRNPEIFGGADVKLVTGIGAVVGFPAIAFVGIVMILAGGLMGAVLLARRQREFPYVPAIAAGLFVFAVFFEYQRFQSLR